MKTTSASQSGSITARLSTAALIALAGTFLGVFAAASPFQSRPPSYSASGTSHPSALASNAIQHFSGRSGLEGFNGSPKGVHGPFPTIQLQQVATGFASPVTVTNAGDGSGRLFIVQQTGEIRILINGTVLPTPFLDIHELVSCCGEQGLLGLAFHPDYADNGFFYVYYTDLAGNIAIARYTVSESDPNVANPDSHFPILSQLHQPFSNHNGGQLAFGPDGYLYTGLGDGGSGDDPQENGQNLQTWLGKILRVDVNGDDFPADPNRNYAVPPDNPFVGNPDALDEIWAYGVRNPWRCTFDRVTGDFFIADVGQNSWEEIDFQPAASAGGENYGWDVLEGMHCHEDDPQGSCDDFLNGGSTLPVLEYSHAFGCSVTGGYRYRGQLYPQLEGIYFYSDYCSGRIWGAIQDIQGRWVSQELLDTELTVTTFGEDEAGEIYVADYSGGTLYQIVGTGPTPTPTPTVTPTPTATATVTVTATPTPTATPSGSPTTTPRPTPTARPAVTPRPRPTPAPRPGVSRVAESLRIVDQNGKPAANGIPSATSRIFEVNVGQGLTFVPSTVNISAGDTVRWTWVSNGHSVTSGIPCVPDGQFCSPDNMNCQAGTLSDAGAVYEHTFTETGTYTYFCVAHCEYGMSGVVNVALRGTPAPRPRPTPAPRPAP